MSACVLRCLAAGAMLAAVHTAGAREVPTVGALTQHNDLAQHGRLRMRTPSILQRTESRPIEPEAQRALAHYDALLALPLPPPLRAEALRRSADLRVQLADGGEAFERDAVALAVSRYAELLSQFPEHAQADRVLYQMARAQLLLGEREAAIDGLRQLGRRFPQSARAADALFRAAELLHAERRYAEAETQYGRLLALGTATGALHGIAQYKRGWSLYQLGRYEEALPVFLALLERELPAGTLEDVAATRAQLALRRGGEAEIAIDALRATTQAFAALGGGAALNDYLARQPHAPRYAVLLYAALGEHLLDKQRYTEAAQAYTAFVARHATHPLAPRFQLRAIEACTRGGFGALAMQARETFVSRYAPQAPYWDGRAPDAAHLDELRAQLDLVGRHHYAAAQALPAAPAAMRRAAFARAAGWLRQRVEGFGDDPGRATLHLLYADALLESGDGAAAAAEYEHVAYGYPGFAQAADAALAGVQALRSQADQAGGERRDALLREAIAASRRLAGIFPSHPQRQAVLVTAAGDLLDTGATEDAIALAQQALADARLAASLRMEALSIVADAHFARREFAQAESAYRAVLGAAGRDDGARRWSERLATAIYLQGEAAREVQDLAGAAAAFLRVGQLVPHSAIRASAEVDAAAALIALKDWRGAQRVLEALRMREPAHALIADGDRKLAHAYEQDGQDARAAVVFQRVARRVQEPAALRREAAWRAASLYDRARQRGPATAAYEDYVAGYAEPLTAAQQARRRLSELAGEGGDAGRRLHWLQEIVRVDAVTTQEPASRAIAARASLEIGRVQAAQARQQALTLPIDRTLPRRLRATEEAVATLARAARYGFDDVAGAATYELGLVYRDLGRALLRAPRPAQLSAAEREQYELLLEEQAFPFEEKAIQALELNLDRLGAGRWDDAIRRSAWVLAELVPAKYGKHEFREVSYDAVD